ncbi:hypothetical protein RhiirA4_476651 [Rhizophagus irregularis]|uniref:Uncharacterized protein n=1 Tax=Rhizophagus irregularis TaxID=588596 RepID=A0A2I1HBX6_9GLOM|nr:hypothetical protein RhiirA4_476651 [Rhizophagus irregularis]
MHCEAEKIEHTLAMELASPSNFELIMSMFSSQLLSNQNDDNDEEYAEIFNEFIDEYIVDFLCKENLNDNKEKGYPMITQTNEVIELLG